MTINANHMILRLTGFGLFILIWLAVAKSGLINPLFIESPELVFAKLVELLTSGNVTMDTLSTIYRTFAAFLIAIGLGVPIGMLLGHSSVVYRIFEPLVDFGRSVPVIALFPLFPLFFSIGDASKIAVAAFTGSLVITLHTMYGVHHSNKTRRLLARTMGADQFTIVRKIEFFEALPYLFAGLRLTISFALVVIIFTEMFLAFTDYGLGIRIYDAYQIRKVTEMYALILFSGIIGYVLNLAMAKLEGRVVHWTGK